MVGWALHAQPWKGPLTNSTPEFREEVTPLEYDREHGCLTEALTPRPKPT
jgi:hypothetical protein